jgi:asparagine N-glycosylation enzyme membrane subunit Stt3
VDGLLPVALAFYFFGFWGGIAFLAAYAILFFLVYTLQ